VSTIHGEDHLVPILLHGTANRLKVAFFLQNAAPPAPCSNCQPAHALLLIPFEPAVDHDFTTANCLCHFFGGAAIGFEQYDLATLTIAEGCPVTAPFLKFGTLELAQRNRFDFSPLCLNSGANNKFGKSGFSM